MGGTLLNHAIIKTYISNKKVVEGIQLELAPKGIMVLPSKDYYIISAADVTKALLYIKHYLGASGIFCKVLGPITSQEFVNFIGE